MTPLITLKRRKNSSALFILAFIICTSCTSILTAKFESDTIGSLPNKTLPGNPAGDEVTFISEIEGQLEVIASPASGSSKALQYKGSSISSSVSGHSAWLGFKAKSSNFAKPVTFVWSARRNFPSSGANLIVDIADGSAVLAARIKISHDGTVRLISDLVSGAGIDIGSLPNNEQHTVTVTVDLSKGSYNIGILKSSGNINRSDVPLITANNSSFHNPARPTVSFKYDNYISSFTYTLDEVFINRKKD
jgi:hypothetical protein